MSLQDPPVVAYYNFKGGVGKTTLVHAHARALAETHGKRVLVVDCDPQCSLTEEIFGNAIKKFAGVNRVGFYDDWIQRPVDKSDTETARTLRAMVDPFWNRGPYAWEKVTPVLEEVECDNGALFLMCGDSNTTRLDTIVTLAEYMQDPPFLKNMIAAPFHAIIRAAKTCRADLVLLDLAPNNGALNRTLIMTSNFVVVPCSPDAKSAQGYISFMRQVPGWLEWKKKIVSQQARSGSLLTPFPSSEPFFLGWVATRVVDDIKNDEIDFQPLLGRTLDDPALNQAAAAANVPMAFVRDEKHAAAVAQQRRDLDATVSVLLERIAEASARVGEKRARE